MRLSFLSTVCALAVLSVAKNVVDLSNLANNIEKRGIQDPLFQEPSTNNDFYVPKGEEPQRGPTLLTSGINVNRDISVFAGYVRDNVAISSRFNNVKKQTVVFAPTDDGIETLSLKPWQYPTPVDDTKSEEEINSVIESNVQDFIESHLVDGEVPFEVLNSEKSNLGALLITENGRKVKLVNDDGEYYVSAEFNGKDGEWLKVQTVTTVDNGAILIINKPLSFPSLL
jgi:hypothetical protein